MADDAHVARTFCTMSYSPAYWPREPTDIPLDDVSSVSKHLPKWTYWEPLQDKLETRMLVESVRYKVVFGQGLAKSRH